MGQALAEPPGIEGRQPGPMAGRVINPGTCQLSPNFADLLAGLGRPAFTKALTVSRPITVLPRAGGSHTVTPPPHRVPITAPQTTRSLGTFGRLPLAFIENQGQVDDQAKFYLRTGEQTLWFTREGIVFDLLRAKWEGEGPVRHWERLAFAQDLVGANQNATLKGTNPQPGTYNYFPGNDPAKWRTGVRGYGEVLYQEVWEGIDLKLYT